MRAVSSRVEFVIERRVGDRVRTQIERPLRPKITECVGIALFLVQDVADQLLLDLEDLDAQRHA
jgi:hypothetical protein